MPRARLFSAAINTLHRARDAWFKLKMRVPARYAVHATVLVVALAVAFQNVQGASAQTATKEADRLARFVELPDQGLITEKALQQPTATGGAYTSARLDVPKLALATDDLSAISLTVTDDLPPSVTDTTALTKPSISRTELADRPRQEIVFHTIKTGETISTIADEYGLSIRTVLNANDLGESSLIKPGAQLKILPVNGILHVVRNGDTLASIAKKYGASQDKIASFNNIKGGVIKAGQKVIVPGGRKPAPPAPTRSFGSKLAFAGSSGGAFGPQSESSGDTSTLGSMVWPNACRNITQYRTAYHTGIDIACPAGSTIVAADGGAVFFASWDGAYGYHVRIRHDNGLVTAYAHIQEGGILVRVGQRVARGQAIAHEGTTGNSTGPHLHFEVIRGGGFMNPLDYL